MTNETKLFENFPILCTNPKVLALETTLLQSFANFKDILLEYEEIFSELESYKSQIFIQKEKCESKSCKSSQSLKQIINEKNKMIQSIANILLEINETKDLDTITDALKIISCDLSPLSPQKSTSEELSPVFEPASIYDKISSNSDKEFTSTSEIDSIPSGRKSPIIQTKKFRNSSDLVIDNVVQEKKKCPEIWPTPEKKMLKLVFATPGKSKSNGKQRQARLNFVKEKTTTVVDLTCSPKESDYSSNSMSQSIKKEVFENDDTILPSPTSGPINFSSVYKSMCKSSPRKMKKTLSLNKLKTKEAICDNKENKSIKVEDITKDDMEEISIIKESNKSSTTPKKFKTPLSIFNMKTECTTFVDENNENLSKEVTADKEIEESINILKHYPERFTKSPLKPQSPILNLQNQEANESISLLQRINQFDKKQDCEQPCSPTKRPSSPSDVPASLSLLNNNFAAKISNNKDIFKRTKPVPVEPIFKEPTVRKKAEKLALPGWSCDECKQFYDELYKDNPEMLRQKMSECSRHRGRRDPARPRTPPGYWQPRWHVPNDTDEFNRLNDAI
ncbi:hypothetical protein RR46_06135 [Papilio xuthus]|uniref:DNA endonuclease RBBP8 n=1 Tax=Papilio xuthus TaxID=66420 RepID=A0A194Q8V3_PAPXU|nr:hypothetical protein RR46_06135 [Papilio xuthus]